MIYQRIVLLLLIMTVLISGCNSPVYNQTEGNIAEAKLKVNAAIKKSNASGKPIPPLVVKDELYVDKTPISLAKQPSWLKNRIVMRGDQLPFSYYSRTIVGGGGQNILTHYQSGLDEAQKISLNYTGTVRGALDILAAKSGYVYTVNGHSVYWQGLVSKTFDIAFMPGSSDYLMGKSGSGSGSISSVASGGATGAVAVSAIIDDSASAQYSNLKGNLSVWKDLENTVKQLLSPSGTVMVSESTSSVTVRDRPTNVSLVGKYIANMNQNLTKQVLIKVQILNVQLSNSFNYGINWDLLKTTLDGTKFSLNMNFSTPISISTNPPFTGTEPTFGVTGAGNSFVTALVSALNQQGKASLVTEPRVVCLNNQVCVMRIVSQQGYLASVQTTSLAGSSTAGGASVTSQITPGNVVTGLTLYILPKILDGKVYLQVNADLSTNDGIRTINSATGTSTTTPPDGSSIIQVPDVTQKQFNQRSVIASGDSLILAGFRQIQNRANAMQLLTSQALGGKAALESTDETIILITPIILHEPA